MADEPHVVEERQPGDIDGVLAVSHGAGHELQVVHEVGVAEHHPLRVAGRAGGVLEEGQVVRGDVRVTPVVGGLERNAVGRRPAGVGVVLVRQRVAEPAGGRDDRGPAVLGDGVEPRRVFVGARRIGGNGRHPRVEAAVERGGEFRTRRIQHQHAVARMAQGQQMRRDGTRPPVEIRVAQSLRDRHTVGKKGECGASAVFFAPLPEQFHEIPGLDARRRCSTNTAHVYLS